MLENYSGATRLIPVVGDPIGQVKSPYGVTQAFEARGHDAICVPMQVKAADFRAFVEVMRRMPNVDGIITTVPHKIAASEVCDTVSDHARVLKTVNTIRRSADGRLHGDMFDGLGFVAAAQDQGCDFKGRHAFLLGAGGAGIAIAHAVASAGVEQLAIAEIDIARRDQLVAMLKREGLPVVGVLPDAAPGFDIAINATPLGMREADPVPLLVTAMKPGTFVADVVTKPEITPLIAAARARGLKVSTGVQMFNRVRDLMVEFLLAPR